MTSPPGDLEAALAAVLREPDADEPRMAYAQASEAHGNRERAEFIRIQLAQRDNLRGGGSILYGFNYPSVARGLELRAKSAQWAGPIASRVKEFVFYGGFVEKIVIDAHQFLATADELFQMAPIRRLNVTGVGPVFEQLLASPHLARMVSLNLEYQNLGDRGIEQLAACPHLGKLGWLSLCGNQITTTGLEALARSDKLPALQNVDFRGNPVYEEVQEQVDDDAGRVAYVGSDLREIEKRFGRKTWLHPVLDHGWRYFEQQEL